MDADNQTRIRKRGGPRPGAGRKPGSKDRATIEQKRTLSEMARDYTHVALQTLVDVATKGASEAARVTAAGMLLDRGYGKPIQAMSHEGPDGKPLQAVPVLNLTVTRSDG